MKAGRDTLTGGGGVEVGTPVIGRGGGGGNDSSSSWESRTTF